MIDEDGTYWWGRGKPAWSEDCRKWLGLVAEIHLSETPQITGEKAIWEVK